MPYPTLPTTYTAPSDGNIQAQESIRAMDWSDIVEASAHLYAYGVRYLGGDPSWRQRTIEAAAYKQVAKFIVTTGANVYEVYWTSVANDGLVRLQMLEVGTSTRTLINTHGVALSKQEGLLAVNPETQYLCTVSVIDSAADIDLYSFSLWERDLTDAEL